MQRIVIGESLRHIATIFKSDWRMFIAICWLPMLLNWLLNLGWQFSLPETKELILHSRYKFEITINIYLAVRIILTSVMLVGIYRYLLNDPRFNLKTLQPKIPAIFKPIRSIPFYFSIDRSTLILAICLIGGTLAYRLGNYFVQGFIIDEMKWSQPKGPSNMWFLTVHLIIFPMHLWSFLCFIISTQLCLIGPYIATADRITRENILQNVIALKGSRFQVFAVPFIIGLCLAIIGMAPFLVIYLIDQNDFLDMAMNWVRFASPVTSGLLKFVSLVLLGIFCAESFRLLGRSAQENVAR
jgi:hypothetical protein